MADDDLVYVNVAWVEWGNGIAAPGRVEVLRWDGASFVPTDLPGYPRIDSLDLTAIAAGPRCQGLPSRQSLTLELRDGPEVIDGDRQWSERRDRRLDRPARRAVRVVEGKCSR